MKKPEWAHWTETERLQKQDEAKLAKVKERKKKGLYVGYSFPGYEDHEYRIRPGLRKMQAEWREAKARNTRARAEEDDEEELPMIKGGGTGRRRARRVTGLC